MYVFSFLLLLLLRGTPNLFLPPPQTNQSTVNYPDYFSADGLFGRFPYLIPNLISALISLVGLVLGWIYLKETLNADLPPLNPAIVDDIEEQSSSHPLQTYKRLDVISEKSERSKEEEGSSSNGQSEERVEREGGKGDIEQGGGEGEKEREKEKVVIEEHANGDEEEVALLDGKASINGESESASDCETVGSTSESEEGEVVTMFEVKESKAEELKRKWQAGFSLLTFSQANLFIGELKKDRSEREKEKQREQKEAKMLLSGWKKYFRLSNDSVLTNRLSLLTCSLYALLGALYVFWDEVSTTPHHTTPHHHTTLHYTA